MMLGGTAKMSAAPARTGSLLGTIQPDLDPDRQAGWIEATASEIFQELMRDIADGSESLGK